MAAAEKLVGEQGQDKSVQDLLLLLQGRHEQYHQWQEKALQLLAVPPLMVHVALVLVVCWIVSCFNLNLPFAFTLGFAYLWHIESRQRLKIQTRIRSEERKSIDRKRLLSDAETARWLNNVVKSAWPVFLEKFASKDFLMRLAPWFLEKYKPWTAKKIVLQQLYLGKSPPVFTLLRAGGHPTEGDHLVLEMSMSFTAARDMAASIAVQMKKRVGLGIWTSFHISNLQVEGKLKVGVRFTTGWPVISRLRICFSEAPVIQMVAKPVFTHGVDVTDLPGIAAWLDKMVIDALEQSLVEPNLLTLDVEKLVGNLMSVSARLQTDKMGKPGDWFFVGKKGALATVLVEILEADRLKPCDPNGKADPYVKIVFGSTRDTTSIKRKTLSPSWHEQFRIPIVSWDDPLVLRMRDKDRFHDDEMGYKAINLTDFKDGQRHDMWLRLDGVKTGRLHVALTIEGLPAEDNVRDSGNSFKSEEGGKPLTPSVASPGTHLITEARETRNTDTDGEAVEPDCEETLLVNACEVVDIGVGQPGCVSILQPGKHVVKEAWNSERLHQRSKARKSIGRDGKSENTPEKSGSQGADMDRGSRVELHGVKPSRMRKIWGRREEKKGSPKDESSTEVSDELKELVAIGQKGTKVHMKVHVGAEGPENLEAGDFELPDSGEVLVEPASRRKSGAYGVKRMGHGMLKQASKTAQNIGHAIQKIHSGKAKKNSSKDWTTGDIDQTILKEKEILTSTSSGEGDEGDCERVLPLQPGCQSRGEDTASEVEQVCHLYRHELESDSPETYKTTTSLESPVDAYTSVISLQCASDEVDDKVGIHSRDAAIREDGNPRDTSLHDREVDTVCLEGFDRIAEFGQERRTSFKASSFPELESSNFPVNSVPPRRDPPPLPEAT